jgi:hypothetical protein
MAGVELSPKLRRPSRPVSLNSSDLGFRLIQLITGPLISFESALIDTRQRFDEQAHRYRVPSQLLRFEGHEESS